MQVAKKIKVVIAGGGTGGHVTPALAVAEELKKHNAEMAFIGSMQGPEGLLVKTAGLDFYGIQAGKLRRYFSMENGVDLFRVGVGFLQARNILARLKPDVVFAKGGYVCVPVVYAAAFLEIPIVSHESDVVMGLANRLAFDKSVAVCTGFPVTSYAKPLRAKLHHTGNPIRSLFRKTLPKKAELVKKMGFVASRPTVLMLGGSQGAQDINQLLFDNLETNLQAFNLIHLTGVNHLNAALDRQKKLPATLQKRYKPHGFVGDELVEFMAVADLVVARSSANVLTELSAQRKAALLIPLPASASDHQRANAQVFKDKGAAIVVEQDALTPAVLTKKITDLLNDSAELKSLERSIGFFDSPDAAAHIAENIIRAAQHHL